MFGSQFFGQAFFGEGFRPSVQNSQSLTATQTQTPSIAEVTAHLRTLSATETQSASIAKLAAHLLALTATETQTPTIARVVAYLRTLAATETQTLTLTPQFVSGGGAVTNQELDVTQTQAAAIFYSYVPKVQHGGGGGKTRETEREPAQYEGTFHAFQRQTVSLAAVLEPVGLSLVEDDEEALLLLI